MEFKKNEKEKLHAPCLQDAVEVDDCSPTTMTAPNEASREGAAASLEADQLTELEMALDLLLQIVVSTVSYLTRRAPHVQVRDDVPLSAMGQTAAQVLVDEQTMANSIEELVADLTKHAGLVRSLVHALPDYSQQEPSLQAPRLAALQAEMTAANADYAAALAEAGEFQNLSPLVPSGMDTDFFRRGTTRTGQRSSSTTLQRPTKHPYCCREAKKGQHRIGEAT